MRETRVNLKHLLEDIRDGYTIPLEEIILVELTANALDSKASCVSFFIDKAKNTLSALDNGQGMRREALADYHNIAATTKVRGRGIGFAGIGAKLSLLLADAVITETKGGYGSRCATAWHLKSETSAPWKFIPFSGKVPYPRGTAVTINLPKPDSLLLSEAFVAKTIERHFYPLFHPELFQLILKHIYQKGVEFFISKRKISFSPPKGFEPKTFQIRVGGRSRKLAGVGYLAKSKSGAVPTEPAIKGLAISTYGKVIKSGWEWIGLIPEENGQIYGSIEIPALAEILTTNKMDFLKDGTSLKKYYQYRKAIQQTVLPILHEFGEEIMQSTQKKKFRSLTKEIERALRFMLGDFPELVPLLGMKKVGKTGPVFIDDKELPLVGVISATESQPPKEAAIKQASAVMGEREQPKESFGALGPKKKSGHKGPALAIGFENRTASQPLSRMMENKIWINIDHPAYLKAREEGFEQYHILFCVAWSLSHFLEDERSPQSFINDFLACWGKEEKRTTRILKI